MAPRRELGDAILWVVRRIHVRDADGVRRAQPAPALCNRALRRAVRCSRAAADAAIGAGIDHHRTVRHRSRRLRHRPLDATGARCGAFECGAVGLQTRPGEKPLEAPAGLGTDTDRVALRIGVARGVADEGFEARCLSGAVRRMTAGSASRHQEHLERDDATRERASRRSFLGGSQGHASMFAGHDRHSKREVFVAGTGRRDASAPSGATADSTRAAARRFAPSGR